MESDQTKVTEVVEDGGTMWWWRRWSGQPGEGCFRGVEAGYAVRRRESNIDRFAHVVLPSLLEHMERGAWDAGRPGEQGAPGCRAQLPASLLPPAPRREQGPHRCPDWSSVAGPAASREEALIARLLCTVAVAERQLRASKIRGEAWSIHSDVSISIPQLSGRNKQEVCGNRYTCTYNS